MPTQQDILKDCKRLLCTSQPVRSGAGVELYDDLERQRLAMLGLHHNMRYWKDLGPKFARFRRRVANRVMLFREPPEFYLIHPDHKSQMWTHSRQQLEEALRDGYEFETGNDNSYAELRNPCAEILIDEWTGSQSFATAGSRPDITGSPYPMHLNHAQLRQVYRALFQWLSPSHRDAVIVEALPHMKISKTMHAKVGGAISSNIGRELIFAFYNERRFPHYWSEFRSMREMLRGNQNNLLYAEGVSRYLYDAFCPGIQKMPDSWKTDTVMSLLRGMRESEEFGTMVILADALMDAGCDNELLLTHLRDPSARFSLGSWVFRHSGVL